MQHCHLTQSCDDTRFDADQRGRSRMRMNTGRVEKGAMRAMAILGALLGCTSGGDSRQKLSPSESEPVKSAQQKVLGGDIGDDRAAGHHGLDRV